MRRSDREAQLREAIQLAQAGQRAEARRLLDELVKRDPRQELAWLWLATVSTEREERIRFLERTLALNPANERAQEAYAQLTGDIYKPSQPPPGTSATARIPPADIVPHRARRVSPVALILFGLLLVLIAVSGVILMRSDVFSVASDDDSTNTAIPRTPTRTPGPSPTPSLTPLPTFTPGPSPTSLWDAPPPTWTPVGAGESATAQAQPTEPPTERPTVNPTATPEATASPSASSTPTVTASPDSDTSPDASAD